MIEILIEKLIKAKTSDEILSCRPDAMDLYEGLYKKMQSETLSKTNFEDIKMLHDLEDPMMAYYGPCFYQKFGIPFLKEHNPKTIDVLELTVLFYIIQVMELLENEFYSDVYVCTYNVPYEPFPQPKKVNLSEYTQNLFETLWSYFVKAVTIKGDGRNFLMEYDSNNYMFYLPDEKYEEVLDMIYKNYDGSNFYHIVEKILGVYRLRFTKMEFILNYQPLFVKVAHKYLCTFTTAFSD